MIAQYVQPKHGPRVAHLPRDHTVEERTCVACAICSRITGQTTKEPSMSACASALPFGLKVLVGFSHAVSARLRKLVTQRGASLLMGFPSINPFAVLVKKCDCLVT